MLAFPFYSNEPNIPTNMLKHQWKRHSEIIAGHSVPSVAYIESCSFWLAGNSVPKDLVEINPCFGLTNYIFQAFLQILFHRWIRQVALYCEGQRGPGIVFPGCVTGKEMDRSSKKELAIWLVCLHFIQLELLKVSLIVTSTFSFLFLAFKNDVLWFCSLGASGGLSLNTPAKPCLLHAMQSIVFDIAI